VQVVGREREIAHLERVLDGLGSGPTRLVVLGDPGIGKTTIWEAGVRAASERGLRVLSARPTRTESSLPYAGLSDLLEDVDDATFASLPDPQRFALDVALLRVAPDGRPTDPRAVFAGFGSVVSTLAQEHPLVLAVDDLQWLDGPSARALEFVGRRLQEAPVALLAAARIEAGKAADNADWLDANDQLRLWPLSPGALHQLIKQRLGVALSRPTLLRLHNACGGNAFFALETARTLLEQDALDVRAAWPIADDVKQIVDGNLAGLPRSVRQALLVIAAAMQPTSSLVESDDLEAAERADLVQVAAGGRLRFVHPLYASAVYMSAPPEERRRVHRDLAERADALERAHHLALATEQPDAAVAAELEQAAALATSRGAPEIAAELYERAAELTPAHDLTAAAGRILAAAGSYLHCGAPLKAATLLEALIPTTDGSLRAAALHLLAKVRFREENLPDALALLHEAAGRSADDAELRAAVELDIALTGITVSFDHEPARAHAAAAVEYASRGHSRGLLASALAVKAMVDFLLGEGVDDAQLARALELEVDDPHVQLEGRPSLIAGCLAFYLGQIDQAFSLLYPIRERLRERGQEADMPFLSLHLAWIECMIGQTARARMLSDEALELASLTGVMNAHALAFAALLDAYTGNEDNCRNRFASALASMGSAEYCLVIIWGAMAVGQLEISLGNHAAADAALEQMTCPLESLEVVDPVHLAFFPDKIEALVALGEIERAERLTKLLTAMGERFDRPLTLAAGERCRASLLASGGDLVAAESALQSALKHLERAPVPLETARALLLLGQVERRRKQKTRAKASLERCMAICQEIDAKLWIRRAQVELARIGTHRAGDLTATESRVAELATAGLTNREIAAAAFMSPKTVEANLSRIYRKLGIRSRAQLGTTLAQNAIAR
jgi:DNA-binding CsgD family transcriptional regulator